ncbi:MAG: metallopeptidase family protein [Patescibacteria group bacterium]
MTREQFEQYIEAAIDRVPEKIRQRFNNVAFVVEAAPRPAAVNERVVRRGGILLGLYQGVPLTRRGPGYSGVLPDKITIFQQAIEFLAGPDENRIGALIHDVVHHEIAHHLGFSEREVRAWERKRKKP